MTDSFLEHAMDILKAPADSTFRELIIARIPTQKRFNRQIKSIPAAMQLLAEPEITDFLQSNHLIAVYFISITINYLAFHNSNSFAASIDDDNGAIAIPESRSPLAKNFMFSISRGLAYSSSPDDPGSPGAAITIEESCTDKWKQDFLPYRLLLKLLRSRFAT
jgi:hypothetical protein